MQTYDLELPENDSSYQIAVSANTQYQSSGELYYFKISDLIIRFSGKCYLLIKTKKQMSVRYGIGKLDFCLFITDKLPNFMKIFLQMSIKIFSWMLHV